MSDSSLNRFCRSMLSVATDPTVAGVLLDPATGTNMDTYSKFRVGGSPSLETVKRLRKVNSRWAAKVAEGFDPEAPDALTIADLLSKDPRKGVRRALATAPGLPGDVFDRMMDRALKESDDELVVKLLTHQSPTPQALARWLSDERAGAISVGQATTALDNLGKVIASDADTVVGFMSSARRVGWAAHALVATLTGPVHFVDVVSASGEDLPRPVLSEALAAMLSASHAGDCDLRTIAWLSERAADLRVDPLKAALADIEDPERIAAWWRSGIEGAREGLHRTRALSAPAVVSTLSTLPEVVGDDQAAARVALLAVSSAPPSPPGAGEGLANWCETLELSLSLVEGRPLPGDLAAELTQAFAEVLDQMGFYGEEPRVVDLFARTAAVFPLAVGPVVVRQPRPVEGVVQLVAADPVRFGVTGQIIVDSMTKLAEKSHRRPGVPAALWEFHPDEWSELLWHTPGVVHQLSIGYFDRTHLAKPVFEHLHRALGSSSQGWDTVLNLVPSWDGSVAELVGVAATFLEDVDVTPPRPTAAPEPEAPDTVDEVVVAEEADCDILCAEADGTTETPAPTETPSAAAEPAEPALGQQLVLL